MFIPSSKETTIVFDLRELSDDVQLLLGELLKPAPEGYYLNNKEIPTFKKGVPYYYIEDYKGLGTTLGYTLIPVEFKGVIDKPIYDERACEVFRPKVPIEFSKYFTDHQTLPYRGFNLIKDIVFAFVYNQLKWGDFPKIDTKDVLYKHLKEDAITTFGDVIVNSSDKTIINIEDIVDRLNDKIIDLKTDILHFMSRDYYNHYDIISKYTQLRIIKMQDYRVYEYEKMLNKIKELDHDDGST